MGNKLSIVGGGKMGEALLAGLIESKWAEPEDMSVIEPDENRLKELQAKYKETIISAELFESTHFLLAVKPQTIPVICSKLNKIKPKLVISNLSLDV